MKKRENGMSTRRTLRGGGIKRGAAPNEEAGGGEEGVSVGEGAGG